MVVYLLNMNPPKFSKKQPKASIIPQFSDKTPRISPSNIVNYDEETIAWLFSMIDLNGKWGWLNIDEDTLINIILPKIKSFEKMTWGEFTKRRSNHHSLPVKNIIKEAQDRLIEIELEDIETLFSFSISGEKRLWGIRDTVHCKILWWDQNHEIYPSEKKHT